MNSYFPYSIQISAKHWRSLDLGALSRQIAERAIPSIIFYRQLAFKLNRQRKTGVNPVHAGQLNLFATLQKVYRYLIDELAEGQTPGLLMDALRRGGADPAGLEAAQAYPRFVELFPPRDVLNGADNGSDWLNRKDSAFARQRMILREMLLLRIAAGNPAIDNFREILD